MSEEQQVSVEELEVRKQQIKEGLITQDEKVDGSKVEKEALSDFVPPPKPKSINPDSERGGMSVGGPAGRKRVKGNAKKQQDVNYSSRRGFQKIWDDKPIQNVGEGVNTTDIPTRRS